MNIVDIIMIVLILLYVAKGFKNGVIKEGVLFLGNIFVIVAAFFLKNPLSVYLYEHAPFLKFSGILSGISVLNILVFEVLSFLIIYAILSIIFKLLVKLTNILDVLVKATIILELPSKILGLVLGAVEGIFVTFILLMVCNQFTYTHNYIEKSKYGEMIITKTPILSGVVEPIYNATEEIRDVALEYKGFSDKSEANLKSLDILLRYEIITKTNAQKLITEGKLNIDNAEQVLNKY